MAKAKASEDSLKTVTVGPGNNVRVPTSHPTEGSDDSVDRAGTRSVGCQEDLFPDSFLTQRMNHIHVPIKKISYIKSNLGRVCPVLVLADVARSRMRLLVRPR